jgi:hypothetical protein
LEIAHAGKLDRATAPVGGVKHLPTMNHAAAIALHTMYYNFVRIHQTLRVTPAMAAGVTKKLWEVSDIVEVLEQWELGQGVYSTKLHQSSGPTSFQAQRGLPIVRVVDNVL